MFIVPSSPGSCLTYPIVVFLETPAKVAKKPPIS